VGVMTWWKIASDRLDERLASANGHEIMPGVKISYAARSTSGFPFGLDTELDGFTLQIQTRTGPLTWRAEHFAIHALTYGRDQQILEAAGVQTVSWTDSDGARRVFAFVPGSLRASAIGVDGRLSRFDLDVVAINSRELTAARLQFHLRRNPDRDALDFAVSGDGVQRTIAGRTGSPQDISVDGTLAPLGPFVELLSGDVDWRSAAEAWREHGGVLKIERIESLQDQIKAFGLGELSLDDLHRLRGRIALTYRARESVTRIGRNRTQAQLRYYWLAQSGQRDASGWPRLTYVLSGGRVYYNSVDSSNIVMAPRTDRNVLFSSGPPSQIDELIGRAQSMREQEAVLLHPLY
jgi:hypothetical protein